MFYIQLRKAFCMKCFQFWLKWFGGVKFALFYCLSFSRIWITFSRLRMDLSLSHIRFSSQFAIEYKISTRHWDKDAIWNIRRKYCENLMNTLSKIQSHSSLRQRRVHFPRVLVKRKIYSVASKKNNIVHTYEKVRSSDEQSRRTNQRTSEWMKKN